MDDYCWIKIGSLFIGSSKGEFEVLQHHIAEVKYRYEYKRPNPDPQHKNNDQNLDIRCSSLGYYAWWPSYEVVLSLSILIYMIFELFKLRNDFANIYYLKVVFYARNRFLQC